MDFPPEVERDETNEYTRVWHCQPPEPGGKFIVIKEHWDLDGPTDVPDPKPVRHILAWT